MHTDSSTAAGALHLLSLSLSLLILFNEIKERMMGISRKLGKSTKKSKISVVMDFPQPSTLGFRTRAAKNLALLRLHSHSPSPSTVTDADSFRYLQLRNRRLEKPQLLIESRKQPKQLKHRVHDGESRNPKANLAPAKSDASIGENNSLDCESGIRSTIACSCEIEEFFEYAEHKQHIHFTEK